MKGLIVDARYGLFTLTGTDLDTDSNSGFQIPWLHMQKCSYCMQSDSNPNCQLQEWDPGRVEI